MMTDLTNNPWMYISLLMDNVCLPGWVQCAQYGKY